MPGKLTFKQFMQLTQGKPAKESGPTKAEVPADPYSKYEHLSNGSPLPPSAEPPTMQPIHATLSSVFLAGGPGTQPLDLVGSDSRLEVQVAPGSFDLSHASVSTASANSSQNKPSATPTVTATAPTATPRRGHTTATPTVTASATAQTTPVPTVTPTPTGTPATTPTPSSSTLSEPLSLVLTQRHGHFAGEMNQLGSYQIQILDANGQPVSGIVFRKPLTFIYHYQSWEMTALDLDPSKLFFTWYDPTESGSHPKLPLSDFILPMHNNAKTHTLTVQSAIMGAGIFTSGVGDAQNQSPSAPIVASVQGNSGQLSYAYPIQVAPAPAGFTPQLQLAYSSEATNEQHSYVSPAGPEGEGWTLSLGAISAEPYPSSSASGANTWYFLSGVDGVSDRLVQDTTITSGTFYDTEHLTHFRIQQVTANGEPCFHVWDTSGTYYEFGCTQDALQYRKDSNGTLHLYAFDLDEMIAPNDGPNSTQKIIQIHYFQDCGSSTGNCPAASAGGTTSIRDAGIQQIVYGTLAPGSGQSLQVAGTVDFHYLAPNVGSGQPLDQTYGTNYNCSSPPQSTILRCDDPLGYTGGNPAPSVMSTLTLSKVVSYVGSDSGGYPAYEYDFSYTDTPFTSYNPTSGGACADPTTNPAVDEYCAGEHLLNQVTPYVYKGGTANALKPLLLHYYSFINTYSDRSNPLPGGAPYIVTIQRSWLDYYFDSERGAGEHIYYNRAYNNTNGTPYDPTTKDNRYDPFYCPDHAGNSNPTLDCNTAGSAFNYPDDRAWTVQAVTQITALSADSSGLNAANTTYSYLLATTKSESGTGCPKDGQQDGNCVGDNWLPIDTGNGNKDADWADFYHGEFRGFHDVSTISPSNDLTVDQYYSTEGWHTPEGDASNYNAGAMYQQDIYQGPSASASALLEETDTVYTGFSTNNSCYGVVDLTYVPCQVSPESSKTTLYEGNTSGSQPWVQTAYAYDDYSPTGSGIGAGYGNVTTETTTSSNASAVTKAYTYTTTDSGYNATGTIFYDVNKVAHSEIDDSSGHKWQCQSFTYDENAPSGAPNGTPGAGWPTTVNTYTSANCTPGSFGTPLTTSYTGYDAYGNNVATVDPLAVANSALYGSSGISHKNGCTLSNAPAILSKNWGKANYTACTTYDAYNAQPTVVANAFSQTTQTQYDYQMGGVPTQLTDANGQNTTMAYTYSSSNGDGEYLQAVSEPTESNGYTFESQNASGCQTSIPSGTITPCFEVDTHSEHYSGAIARTFYDGQGRVVESAAPTAQPSGGNSSSVYFSVVLTEYNDSTHSVWKTLPFIYASGSGNIGWLDPSSVQDYTSKAPTGTVTYDDALNRPIATDDPLLGTSAEPGSTCSSLQQDDALLHLSSYTTTTCTVYELDGVSGFNNDNNTYESIKSIDANLHVMETLQDALGNTRYQRYDSGANNTSLSSNELVAYQYNVLNEPASVTVTDQAPQSGETTTSVTATMQYDDLGRLTQLVDPDRGTHTYSYDPDGNLLTDVSGTRTLGYNYDLLGRLGCLQNAQPTINATGACSAGSPLVQNTYDVSAPGVTWTGSDYPVGRLTQSVTTTDYPEGTNVATSESTQYDTRGRAITAQMALTLPSGWNVTTALPTYQLSQSYDDADQPTTTQTSTISNGQSTPGYTFRQIYDSATGALTGLANNSTNAANLATQLLNNNAQLATLNLQTSSNTALASEQFTYDGDLRPYTLNATWSSGSGTSGTIFTQSRSYDPVGNVSSLTTTLAAVPGQSGSGGSETQDFCYDEQNRLVYASNTQAPSPTGSQTCGNATPSSGLISGSYSDSFVYTHLGQLWQGPLNDGPTQYQYLYCNTSLHQLSGLYPVGDSCSSKSGAVYKNSSYDAWGNVTGITSGGTSYTLAYDALDRLVKDTIDSNDNEHYAYGASGTRTLRRTVSGGTPTLTVYAFGLEEHTYSANGTLQNNTYYYSLNGRLIGELTGLSTQTINMLLTDPLGSVLATLSNTAGSAALSGNQAYGPYGHLRYNAGGLSGMGTSKGFTGQYSDAFSGLDYYDARYYQPAVGIFLSADSKEGNTSGMDPYMYVGGNPETYNDPTGNYYSNETPITQQGGAIGYVGNGTITTVTNNGVGSVWSADDQFAYTQGSLAISTYTYQQAAKYGGYDPLTDAANSTGAKISHELGLDALQQTWSNPNATWQDKVGAVGQFALTNLNNLFQLAMIFGGPEDEAVDAGGEEGMSLLDDLATCEGLSFTPATPVATSHGEQAIGTMKVGEKVWAYNPRTKKMELQAVQHVWINHDNDLVDLTLTIPTAARHGKAVLSTSEVIHTNKKHPFLTEEKGFLPVGQIKLGMHVLRADGSYGVVTGWKVVAGTKVMYNLEVAQDHTFTVGVGQWVVHNCPGPDITHEELPTDHPDAQSAFEYAMNQIGGPLSEDAQPTFARGLHGDDAVSGLQNGYRDSVSSWRLDYDPKNGPHFNWMLGRRTDNMYGAAKFPGSYDTYINMLLGLNEGGIDMMLQLYAP